MVSQAEPNKDVYVIDVEELLLLELSDAEKLQLEKMDSKMVQERDEHRFQNDGHVMLGI